MEGARGASGPTTRSRSSAKSELRETSQPKRKRVTHAAAAADEGSAAVDESHSRRSRRLKLVAKADSASGRPAAAAAAAPERSSRRKGKAPKKESSRVSRRRSKRLRAEQADGLGDSTAAPPRGSPHAAPKRGGKSRRSPKRVRKAKAAPAMSGDEESPELPGDALAEMAAALAAAEGAPAPGAEDGGVDPASALQQLLARVASGGHPGVEFGGGSPFGAFAGGGSLFSRGGGGSRYSQLLDDLSADEDDFRQETALRKLADILLMGNEETLAGFRPESFVPVLHQLLQADHRPQVALLACDALHNMVEAIPQSSSTVAQCAPSLCAKLMSIEYIDLAERALDTIGKLAVDQGSALLKAGGLNSALSFIDFFPIALQRSAVATAAKLCAHVSPAQFQLCKDVVPQLSSLLERDDKALVESACTCFAKLIQRCEASPDHVMMLTEHNLVSKLLALVSSSPQVVGRSTVSEALGMIAAVLRACPILAEGLHEQMVGEEITPLLVGQSAAPADRSASGDASVSRNMSRNQSASGGTQLQLSATQLGHTMDLVHALLPPLPTDVLAQRAPTIATVGRRAVWQWRDGDLWATYGPDECATLEAAHTDGEHECFFSIGRHEYAVDLEGMVQTNQETGTLRKIQRVGPPVAAEGAAGPADSEEDPRAVYFAKQPQQLQQFCEPMIAPLFELLLSTANPQLTRKVLDVLVKMLHFCSAEGLAEALRNLAVSSYLTNVLRSGEPDFVVGALQMASDLITKLPDIFAVYFRRQGVMFEICRLSSMSAKASAGDKRPRGKGGKGKARAKSPKSQRKAPPGFRGSREQIKHDHDTKLSDFAADAAYQLLETHFEGAAARDGPLADPHPSMDLLRKLNALADQIDPEKEADGATREKALEDARDLIAAADTGVSSFEVWSSGLLSALLAYLSVAGKDEVGGRLVRVKHFCATFFKAAEGDDVLMRENEALRVLVEATHGAINHTESFSCDTLDENDAFLHTLKTPIKLQLVPADGTALKDLPSSMVMIEPFASVQAIEDFLWPRVRRSAEEKARDEAAAAESAAAAAAAQAAADAGSPKPAKSSSRTSLRKRLSSFGRSSKSPKGTAKAAAAPAPPSPRLDEGDSSPVGDSGDDDGDPYSGLFGESESDADGLFSDADDEAPTRRSGVVDLSDLGGDADAGSPAAAAAAPAPASMEIEGAAAPAAAAAAAAASDDAGASKGRASDMAAAGGVPKGGRGRNVGGAKSGRRIQVLMNGVPLEQTTTIYQAIQQQHAKQGADKATIGAHRYMAGRIYTVTYREFPDTEKASDGAPAEGMEVERGGAAASAAAAAAADVGEHPVLRALATPPPDDALSPKDPVYVPLMLLRALHTLNASAPELLPESPSYVTHLLHPLEFINNSVASKLTRQVSDLEKICAGSFPAWCHTLISACPFVVPLESKKLFFFYTAFGSVRALVHYQTVNSIPEAEQGDRALPSRISRIKVKISRKRVFRSLLSMEESMVNSRSIMEIMFKDEIGTGLGPTLEFYALASRAWQEKVHKLWRDEYFAAGDAEAESPYVFASNGLYPLPRTPGTGDASADALFRTFGMFIARAMLDGRILDIALNRCFMVWLRGREEQLGLADLRLVDPGLHDTLTKLHAVAEQRAAIVAGGAEGDELAAKLLELTVDGCAVNDLSLTFVLPGFPEVELCQGGADRDVTLDNVAEYVTAVVRTTLVTGVRAQMHAVRAGFNAVFSLDALKIFSPAELELIVSGSEPAPWDAHELKSAMNADHGYSRDSIELKYLCDVMSEFDADEQRLFLSFITGSPRLPVGGFAALRPRFTVVRKKVSRPDDELPSVMTCQNYLKLPPYSSAEVCRNRLTLAMNEGRGSFLLS